MKKNHYKDVILFALVCLTFIVAQNINGDCAKLQERCSVFKKCCPGFSCHPFLQKCFHSPRQFGEPCMAGHECDAGLSCQPVLQKCYHVPRQYSEPCGFDNPCAAGLSCGETEKKCYTNPRKQNEPCDPTTSCGANLACRDGKCQPPLDCSKCNLYPQLCNYIEDCVKYCKLNPFHAGTCYKEGRITLDTCQKLYSKCGWVDPCEDCKNFPTWCKDIDHCVKDCHLDPPWVETCYHAGEITKEKCLELYPRCKDPNPECNSCKLYPSLCTTIDICIQKCGIRKITAQSCKDEGYITLEKCKQLYPNCK
jgi:hypothetical protein